MRIIKIGPFSSAGVKKKIPALLVFIEIHLQLRHLRGQRPLIGPEFVELLLDLLVLNLLGLSRHPGVYRNQVQISLQKISRQWQCLRQPNAHEVHLLLPAASTINARSSRYQRAEKKNRSTVISRFHRRY